MLDFQPLSTLKQKSRNRLDVENDMISSHQHTPKRFKASFTDVSSVVPLIIAYVLFSFAYERKHSESNT